MKAELGRTYKTRDGVVVSVVKINGGIATLSDNRKVYSDSGKNFPNYSLMESPQDLMEEIVPPSVYNSFVVGKTYVNKSRSNENKYKCLFVGTHSSLFEKIGSKSEAQILNNQFSKFEEFVEKKSGVRWMNVFPSGSTNTWPTRLEADNFRGMRIACIEVKWTEGQGL